MSGSVRPHRRQPTWLPRPWVSPGKNTGEGCHFLLQCMKVKSESEVTQSCPTLGLQPTRPHGPHGLQPTRPLRPSDFPGKGTGVGCHCLLPPSSLRDLYFLTRDQIWACGSENTESQPLELSGNSREEGTCLLDTTSEDASSDYTLGPRDFKDWIPSSDSDG